MNLNQDEILRYSRHMLMPEVGFHGQQRLKNSAVLVVGTGGLGSPLALYLAAAGVGRIGIVDYDVVDSSNLQRQVIHDTNGIGQPKVESARARMLALNPYIQVDTWNEVLRSENAYRISEGFDVLVDGTDNFPTRYLLNDLAVLTGRPYVYGSIFRFEGQVSVFDAQRGPCYRCLFPEPPPPGMVPTCAEGGVFGVLPGTVGTLQGTEVIKLLLGIGEPLIGKLLLYDALEMSFQTVQLRKNPRCVLCGQPPQITGLIDYEAFCGIPARGGHDAQPVPEVSVQELAQRLQSETPPRLLDVRDPVESQVSNLPGALIIPVDQLPARLDEVNPAQEWVVFCRSGSRSARAVEILRQAGYANAANLRGGINAWAREIDPTMREY